MSATQSSVPTATTFLSSLSLRAYFSVTLSFSPLHHGTKSYTVVIIIFYATNDFSFFFFLNFRIISKSILHNHSNSIRKLNYERRKWANTFLFSFFSSCLFFLSWSWVVLLFFLLFFSRLFFLFFLELRCSSFFFSAGHFPFSFWRVPNLFFVFLVSFPCFLFSGALCFLSLSLDRLKKPLRNRFFSDRLRGTMVTQSKTISWTICPSSGTKYVYVPYSQLTLCAK